MFCREICFLTLALSEFEKLGGGMPEEFDLLKCANELCIGNIRGIAPCEGAADGVC